jgi:GTP-binding protein Era
MDNAIAADFRSGFVAIAGRPNVGKSTLVNRIIGEQVSIVTEKEQTTRNRITGIYTTDKAQLALQDIPGILDPKTPLNKSLVSTAMKTLEETDVILFMVTPSEAIYQDDRQILSFLKSQRRPCVLAINKIDTIRPQALLPFMDLYSREFEFKGIYPISALTGQGVTELIEALVNLLPLSPPLFPTDDISDLPTRFFVSEMIREQIIKKTGQEIPYKTAVVVEGFHEESNRISIQADIHVERDSQKKIIIGKGGSMIKAIGIAARENIEEFLGGARVRLELFVKVTPNWTRSERDLKEFGY